MKYCIAVAREGSPRKDNQDAVRCAESVREALRQSGIFSEICFFDPAFFSGQAGKLRDWLARNRPACVFNLFEGFSDDSAKEVEFAAVLEQSGIAFTGNSSRALSACLDKSRCKAILRECGIAVPDGQVVTREEDLPAIRLEYPMFVKPCCEDASVGIDAESLCLHAQQLERSVRKKLRQFPGGLMVEEFIDGREYNAAYLGSDPYELLAVSELDYARHAHCRPFISYESKWDEASRDYRELNFRVLESMPLAVMFADCQTAARRLGCRGYFRMDLREKNGRMYLLDVNPNPDINEDAGFIRQARAAGWTYPQIIKKIFSGACHGG